jgi:hypothetical protein
VRCPNVCHFLGIIIVPTLINLKYSTWWHQYYSHLHQIAECRDGHAEGMAEADAYESNLHATHIRPNALLRFWTIVIGFYPPVDANEFPQVRS